MFFLEILKILKKKIFSLWRFSRIRKRKSLHLLKDSGKLLYFLFTEHIFVKKETKRSLFVGCFCMILVALTTGFLTSTLRPVFDRIFHEKQLSQLPFLAIMAFFLFSIKGFGEYGFNISIVSLNKTLSPSLQLRSFAHMMALPFNFFQKTSSGYLTSLLLSDIEIVNNNIVESLGFILNYTLQIFVLFFVMMRENAVFSLFFLGVGPIVFFSLLFLTKRIEKWTQESAKDVSRLHTFFNEVFHNILFIRSSCLQEAEIKTLEKEQNLLFKHQKDLQNLRCFINPAVEIFGGLSIVVVMMVGGYQVIEGYQTTGSFMTFLASMLMLYQPIKNALKTYTKLEEGLMAVKRIKDLLKEKKDTILTKKSPYIPFGVDENKTDLLNLQGISKNTKNYFSWEAINKYPKGKANKNHEEDFQGMSCAVNFTHYIAQGKIQSLFKKDLFIKNACFSYDGLKPIFQRMSCVFPGGKSSLIMGPSGSGKSTLFYLLLRLYCLQGGEIFFGDTPLSFLHPQYISPWISWVGQNGSFFSHTILHNLLYGLPPNKHESWETFFPEENGKEEWVGLKHRVVEAAKLAKAHEFIESLPQGYNTVLGPRGLTLSGGQRQRLSLARAFLKNAPLVLLDEATSALDSENDCQIYENLKNWSVGKTLLSISHNPHHQEHHDHIFFLSKEGFVQQK